MKRPTNIMGIDLSLTDTGLYWNRDKKQGSLRVRPKTKGVERLIEIQKTIADTIFDNAIRKVVMEGFAYNKGYQAHQIGEAHGVVKLMLHQWAIPCVIIPPATLKQYATGKGNAKKDDMYIAAVADGYEGDDNHNVIDAYWLWKMGIGGA